MTQSEAKLAKQILEDREKRKVLINQLTKKYNVICLKANIPGLYKNLCYAKLIIYYFDKKLKEIVGSNNSKSKLSNILTKIAKAKRLLPNITKYFDNNLIIK